MLRFYLISTIVLFVVLFNLGFVFHDLLLGDWFHQKIGHITREHYIIPLIAVSYLIYSAIQSFLFPIFREYSQTHYGWTSLKSGIVFGLLIGFLWDSLEGGLIEFATMTIPLESFLVDSLYHTLEGGLAGLLAALVYRRTANRNTQTVNT